MAEIAKNPTLVVTGAAGFIGSRILNALLETTAPESLIAVDNLELFKTRDCTSSFRDLPLLFLEPREFLKQWSAGTVRPAAAYHMGACSSTDEMRVDYLNEVNFGYSCRIWELSSAYTIPLVYASSASSYGNGELGFSDDSVLLPQQRPLNPYGWSKHRFDLYVQNSAAQQRAPSRWVGLKFFNVYGPGEAHKGPQASAIFHARNQFLKTGAVKLFKSDRSDVKDGEQKRDFVYVDDCVSVALAAARGDILSGLYNVGTGTARSFMDLAKAVANSLKMPLKIDWIETPQSLKSHYQYFTQAEIKNLNRAGYSKSFKSLEEGVAAYIQELGK